MSTSLMMAISAVLHPAQAASASPVVCVQRVGSNYSAIPQTVTLKKKATAGNTLVIAAVHNSAAVPIPPNGFVHTATSVMSGTSSDIWWYTKTADGTETSISVDWDHFHTYDAFAAFEYEGTVVLRDAAGAIINPWASPHDFGATSAPPSAAASCAYYVQASAVNDKPNANMSVSTGWEIGKANPSTYSYASAVTHPATGAAVDLTLTSTGLSGYLYSGYVWVDKS